MNASSEPPPGPDVGAAGPAARDDRRRGKYELLRKIGSGAMGRGVGPRARVAASLSRKTRHIVAVTDHGQDGDLGYLVMELLEGESLDARIARTGPLPLAKVVPMIIQIARGLSIAHAEGVTHRDLKPSNVFVTLDEEGNALAKVLDFGIAKLRRGDRNRAFATQRGFLLGTPAYMSPEQARGKPVDHRADVWALAVIAYHMLTGEFPFDAGAADELFARIIRVDPIPILERRPELPSIVGDFFVRAFAKRVEDRFQSALSLAGAFEQLEPLADGKLPLSLPPPPALAVIDEDFDLAGLTPRRARRRAASDSSVFVAGLPPKRRVGRALVAGLLVGAVLAVTGVVLSVYFEREPASRTPAVVATGVVSPLSAPPPNSAREIPPPTTEPEPPPPVTAVAPSPPVPVAPPRLPRAPAPRPAASLATSEAASAPAPAPAPSPRVVRNVDRSDVF